MSAKNNSTTSTANNSPRAPRTQAEVAKQNAREVAAYFGERRPESDSAAVALADLMLHLLHDSPGRARLAHTLYCAVAHAIDELRAENGASAIYATDKERDAEMLRRHCALIDAIRKEGKPTGKAERHQSRRTPDVSQDVEKELEALHAKLAKLDSELSNEGKYFEILTKIYHLENQSNPDNDMWPDLIDS